MYTVQSRVGNWSLEVGGSALSWPGGWSLQTETTMDHREKILLNGTLEGRCLQTTAGYVNGKYGSSQQQMQHQNAESEKTGTIRGKFPKKRDERVCFSCFSHFLNLSRDHVLLCSAQPFI